LTSLKEKRPPSYRQPLFPRGVSIVLERIFTAEGDRSITPVVSVLPEIRTVHIVNSDPVIVPIESIEKVCTDLELVPGLAAPGQPESLQDAEVGIPESRGRKSVFT
jgi:hypothetical protein